MHLHLPGQGGCFSTPPPPPPFHYTHPLTHPPTHLRFLPNGARLVKPVFGTSIRPHPPVRQFVYSLMHRTLSSPPVISVGSS